MNVEQSMMAAVEALANRVAALERWKAEVESRITSPPPKTAREAAEQLAIAKIMSRMPK